MSARDLSLSQQLAAFVAGVPDEALPLAVIERAKRHLLDTLGAALGGAVAAEPRSARAVMLADGPGAAPVWGTRHRLSPRNAAFVNGVAAHALELDDSGGCDHSGAVVLPAAFAALACSPRPVSGRAFLTAMVLGYDVGRRVLEACGGYSPHNARGWHSTMTCGVFGAAAASARLIGLDAAQTAASFGHAGSFSGGLWGFIHDASQTKRMHTGRAAESGLLAALLARHDISGPTQVFTDVWGGFFNAFAPDTQNRAALLHELGDTWKIMRCSIKPHASCRSAHAAVDAMLDLIRERYDDPAQVQSVHVRLSGFVERMCGGRDLRNLASSQMSLPYALAAVLVHGHAGIGAYLDAARGDPRVAQMLARITLDVDPAMSDLDEPMVTLTLHGEPPRSRQVPTPLGDPLNPLSDAQLLSKYRSLTALVLDPASANALADAILDLENLADARSLATWLPGDADTRPVLR
ncbi:MmgE/PrpD family protein [Paraburkholderia bryophila]|uniref:MmgE/PrpD family protein n=1 Tax=Paraburkholderia bryophila TaxID=420952 RepID=UPI002349CA5D|nr:MmgE/PrpD family protein [Paraburkholderia bryophila]WCM21853.1 MmgE/PrpD family protein [Paraburkholderia bryophila]